MLSASEAKELKQTPGADILKNLVIPELKEAVDLLPYHRFGTAKYEMLGIPYQLNGVTSPDEEQKESYKRIFINLGLDCVMH